LKAAKTSTIAFVTTASDTGTMHRRIAAATGIRLRKLPIDRDILAGRKIA